MHCTGTAPKKTAIVLRFIWILPKGIAHWDERGLSVLLFGASATPPPSSAPSPVAPGVCIALRSPLVNSSGQMHMRACPPDAYLRLCLPGQEPDASPSIRGRKRGGSVPLLVYYRCAAVLDVDTARASRWDAVAPGGHVRPHRETRRPVYLPPGARRRPVHAWPRRTAATSQRRRRLLSRTPGGEPRRAISQRAQRRPLGSPRTILTPRRVGDVDGYWECIHPRQPQLPRCPPA